MRSRLLAGAALIACGVVAWLFELAGRRPPAPESRQLPRRIEPHPDHSGARRVPVKVVRSGDARRVAPTILACSCGEAWPVMEWPGTRNFIVERFLRCPTCGEWGERV